jgi:hypothetical protein
MNNSYRDARTFQLIAFIRPYEDICLPKKCQNSTKDMSLCDIKNR